SDDGAATVTTTFDSVETLINGAKQRLPIAGQSFKTTLDRSGRWVKQEGLAPGSLGGIEQLIEVSRMIVTPDGPLKAGEDWKYNVTVGEAKKQKVSGTVTILGLEKKSDELTADMLKVRNV